MGGTDTKCQRKDTWTLSQTHTFPHTLPWPSISYTHTCRKQLLHKPVYNTQTHTHAHTHTHTLTHTHTHTHTHCLSLSVGENNCRPSWWLWWMTCPFGEQFLHLFIPPSVTPLPKLTHTHVQKHTAHSVQEYLRLPLAPSCTCKHSRTHKTSSFSSS